MAENINAVFDVSIAKSFKASRKFYILATWDGF